MTTTFDMHQFVSKRFTNKGGEDFVTRTHFATFNDKHNASRSKIYMVLWYRRYRQGKTDGLTLGQLHRESGVGYNYLKTRLARWCAWGFIERKLTTSNSKPVYVYLIAERGRHFVEDIIPEDWLQKYAALIRAVKRGNRV